MALVLEKKGKEQIEIISYLDDAVKCSDEDYQLYIESFKEEGGPDESLLQLDGEPTRFVCKLSLSYEQDTEISRKETKVVDGRMEQSGAVFTEMFRLSFIDIVNPSTLPQTKWIRFKKEGSGGASKVLMNDLKQHGILTPLTVAWANASIALKDESKKKKESQEKKS